MERRVPTACPFYRRFNLPPCHLLLIGIMAAVLGVSNVAHGATFYLDTASGNDANPGTASQPWKSLAQVQAGARAGDTIVIQFADAGLYAARWPSEFSYRASVLKSFTITWTFDTAYPVGQFATGDFWVVGPVRLIGIDPPSVKDATGRVSNGSMRNPPAGSYIPQGFDSAMANNPYDPALNVAFGVSPAHPLEMAPGSSLVSSVSIATVGSLPQLDRAAILTVLAAPAAPGSFRPPYCLADKTVRFNKSALNYALLQKLAPVAGTPALSAVEAQFAAPWIEHTGGWVARYLRPKQNMPDYGREMHTAIGTAALMLHLNFTNEQKEKLLVEFVQLGIDLYAVATHGGGRNWVGEGGQAGGRKWPILFAGLMLNDAAMKATGTKSGDYLYQNGYGPGNMPPDYICFGEDDQTFYVAQLDVDVTHSSAWNPDYRDTQRIPYEAADIGLPEWGIGHVRFPGTSNKWLPTEYRSVAGPPFHGTALAALLTPGGKAQWNHNAYFDYTDRYMAFTAPGGEYAGWWRSMSTFTATMWDTYRAQCGPIWPAAAGAPSPGPVLLPPGDQQVTAGQTLTFAVSATGGSGALTYSASGLPTGATFAGRTFTWTPGATQAGVYTVTFTVSDGAAQDSKSITITVTKPNSPPVLALIGNQSTSENQALTFTVSATDADGDPLTYSATGLPTGASLTGQTFRWTPTYSQAGSYNVTFSASDGNTQTSQTITIVVANTDQAPVLADIGNQSVNAGSLLTFTLSATDPDGDPLTYSAGTLPSGAGLVGQTFSWTPASAQAGSYNMTFTASDSQLQTSQNITVTVLNPDQPPAATAIRYLNTISGNDGNPGTSSAPWQTLAKVQSSAAAGDTIIIQSADAATYAAAWPTHVSYQASVLQQFGITWTFDTTCPVGQFANRDFWVVGPVKIIGIDPPSALISGRIKNGSMVNPAPANNNQGYDSAMSYNTYDAALNAALDRSASNPLVLAANSSLVSTISVDAAGSLPQLQRAAILTVLTSPATPGSFRPPYCGADKTIQFNKSALNYSLLKSLAPVAETPTLASVEDMFAAPWLDHQAGWVARYQHPSLNMPDYGREMYTNIGIGALMLHLNFTNAQKETLLIRYVQLGIDLYGVASNGAVWHWVNDGGQGGGRKWPILFAGLMLDDAAMKSTGAKSGDYLYQNGYGPAHNPPDYVHFGEDDQTFYVASLDVSLTNGPTWNPDSQDSVRTPYSSSDIGLPEWGIRHADSPDKSNKYLPTQCRSEAGPPFHGTALAALLTPGGKALWNHNAFFDYTDRYMAFTAPGGEYAGWWRSMSTFTANMWDTYRAQCGPIWSAKTGAGGTAPALVPLGDQQVTAGQTLTFTVSATDADGDPLTYSATGLPTGAAFSGQTFTWTPEATQAGSYTVTFTVSDGAAQDSKAITIAVTKPNSAPVLALIGDKSTSENQALTFTVSATDADGDPLTYSATGLPTGASLTGQTFTWTPTYSQAGSYNVTFTAGDSQLQTSQAVTITVVNVDRPPVLAAIGNKTVEASKPLSFVLSAADPDGESLTYSADALPSGAALTGQTFAWTPTSSQTGAYTVTFTVSDGLLTDSKTVTITVAGTLNDQIAPVVVQSSPTADAIQVPLNNLVTLHITDANSGVDANSVAIQVDGGIVYQGNVEVYTSATGRCSRSGTKNDYRFIYQPNAMFGFDQKVAVRVKAADLAGNIMSEYQNSFTTDMRAFGKNTSVSPLGGNADSQSATASDPAGNLWVAWHAGAVGSREIYVAKRPVGASAFQTPVRLTTDKNDQCNPALVVSATSAVYVAWQDNRSGNWDLYASACSDGANFSKEVRVTNSTHNEINPALAVDHQSPARVYVAWQDDRNGNQDIYAASSTNAFATSTVSQITNNAADQKEPALAVDSGNVAYVFWTDMRNGQADVYAAASNTAGWPNVPVVVKPGEQSRPAGAAGAGTALHLLWVDNSGGNKDVYYAALNGLPGNPVAGVSIIDDSSGADQTAPAIVCGSDQRVFACWTDARHTGAADTDTDLYVAELRAGTAGTNILVGDDGTNANQGDPAIGVDRYGEPYVVWTDYRNAATEIYSAATTLIDPNPLDSKTVVAAVGGTIGTNPAAINGPEDVSLVVPAGACQADLRMTIWRILNPQVAVSLGSYEFGPSGSNFDQPVTVTIPYTTSTGRRVLPYWYDSVTGALSQQGITDIQNLYISSKLNALQFRTTHFTTFYLVEADENGVPVTGTGGVSGGCAISSHGEGSPGQLLAPYAAIGVIVIILRRRDRRKRSGTLGKA